MQDTHNTNKQRQEKKVHNIKGAALKDRVNTIGQTRTKQGGVVIENKEAGQGEHMANTNKDTAMCSGTK